MVLPTASSPQGKKYNKIPLVKIFKTTELEYDSLIIALLTIEEKEIWNHLIIGAVLGEKKQRSSSRHQ